jgi:hypothetical protein
LFCAQTTGLLGLKKKRQVCEITINGVVIFEECRVPEGPAGIFANKLALKEMTTR